MKFHMVNALGDGLNCDIITPDVIMPKPELKIPKAPDAKFEIAADCLNWVSMYFGMNVQNPIRPIMKNDWANELYTSILFVKIRFIEVLKSETQKLSRHLFVETFSLILLFD